jgi:TolA-binding protein
VSADSTITRLGDKHELQSQISQLEKTVNDMQVQQLLLQQSLTTNWQKSINLQKSE